MNEKKLVPRRRFEEFQNADAWEQRKLGDIAEKITVGIATSSSKYFSDSQNGVPFIKNQDIKENKLNTSNLEYISKEFDKKNINKRIQAGDILTARTGYPGLSAVVPEYLNGAQTFTTLITRIIKEQASPFFISIYINSPSGMKQINGMEAGGAQKNVNAGILKEMNTTLPSLDEQYKISDFVLSLESIITLHQRKLEKTKALKSAYLAEMFPAEGERVPKRRFAGFTDEWEEWKLDDVAIYRRGSFPQPYGKREWYDEVNGMPFVQVVDVGKNLKLVDNTKQKISKLAQPNSIFVEKGKILVTLQGSIGRVAITQYPSYIDRTLLLFESYKLPIDTIYFAYIIQRLFEIEKLKAPGGTIKTITKEALNAFIVLLPNVKEQIAIGKFFKKLDESINNQQQKLNKLKAMKQAYLQEMFV